MVYLKEWVVLSIKDKTTNETETRMFGVPSQGGWRLSTNIESVTHKNNGLVRVRTSSGNVYDFLLSGCGVKNTHAHSMLDAFMRHPQYSIEVKHSI